MTEAVQRLQTDKPAFARQAASNAVLIVALGFFLLADVAMVCGVGSINDEMGGVYLGVLFSQSALAAVWIAWGPISFLGRTAIGMTVVLALVLMLGVSLILSGVPWDILWISLLPLLTCIANWVPLFYVRLRVGIHLGWNSQCSQLEADKHQFGIKQLLLATTIIGAMLGIGRATLTFRKRPSGP